MSRHKMNQKGLPVVYCDIPEGIAKAVAAADLAEIANSARSWFDETDEDVADVRQLTPSDMVQAVEAGLWLTIRDKGIKRAESLKTFVKAQAEKAEAKRVADATELRDTKIAQLVDKGHTEEEAEAFLPKSMFGI